VCGGFVMSGFNNIRSGYTQLQARVRGVQTRAKKVLQQKRLTKEFKAAENVSHAAKQDLDVAQKLVVQTLNQLLGETQSAYKEEAKLSRSDVIKILDELTDETLSPTDLKKALVSNDYDDAIIKEAINNDMVDERALTVCKNVIQAELIQSELKSLQSHENVTGESTIADQYNVLMENEKFIIEGKDTSRSLMMGLPAEKKGVEVAKDKNNLNLAKCLSKELELAQFDATKLQNLIKEDGHLDKMLEKATLTTTDAETKTKIADALSTALQTCKRTLEDQGKKDLALSVGKAIRKVVYDSGLKPRKALPPSMPPPRPSSASSTSSSDKLFDQRQIAQLGIKDVSRDIA
tara:strand:- start:4187 stop:5230 length:1044 start_codon:yes stop_codon:yes gene_type:complete